MTDPAEAVRAWVDAMVVGEDLCPFAGAVVRRGAVHYAVTGTDDVEQLAQQVVDEALALRACPPAERSTTLVVAPGWRDFDDYLDALGLIEALFEACGLAGELQIASFHPDYRFADAAADDPAHASNQAPHPVFHLLREDEVGKAVDGHPDVAAIPERNVAHLRALGWAEIRRRRGW